MQRAETRRKPLPTRPQGGAALPRGDPSHFPPSRLARRIGGSGRGGLAGPSPLWGGVGEGPFDLRLDLHLTANLGV
ncbi:hypothetical protein EBB04_02325 [Sinorhizobium meliloti]|nr:hypothetical protein EBB04_02325 [Sinorhizobium meliloti]